MDDKQSPQVDKNATQSTDDRDPNIGELLTEARKQRGLSESEVAAQTRIPAKYLAMLEAGDYGNISDQLYLLPFLRRYAAYLELDCDEITLRFIRDVQRADGGSGRSFEPLLLEGKKRFSWLPTALVVVAAITIVGGAILRHRLEKPAETAARSSPAATTAAPLVPIREASSPAVPTRTPAILSGATSSTAASSAAGAHEAAVSGQSPRRTSAPGEIGGEAAPAQPEETEGGD